MTGTPTEPETEPATLDLKDLLKQKEEELATKRLSAADGSSEPSLDEQLLLAARQTIDAAEQKASPSRGAKWANTWLPKVALLTPIIALPVTGWIVSPSSSLKWFQLLAISASIMAAIAALLRLIAHGRFPALDRTGKALGLAAAILAIPAAAVLGAGVLATG